MEEYDKQVLIDELQKLVVTKAKENKLQAFEIKRLKEKVEQLEHLLTPKIDK